MQYVRSTDYMLGVSIYIQYKRLIYQIIHLLTATATKVTVIVMKV
jgi:hypothetical protein